MRGIVSKEYLAVCYGFVTSIPSELLTCPLAISNDGSIFVMIVNSLFPLYIEYANDYVMLTSVLKILSSATQRICMTKDVISVTLLSMMMNFLISHLDHSQNIIKHLSRDCVHNLIIKKNENCIRESLNFIRSSEGLNGRICVLMQSVSISVSASVIIICRPKLVEELLNAGQCDITSTYFLATFITLMTSHFFEIDVDSWFQTWILPVFMYHELNGLYLEEILLQSVKLSSKVMEELQSLWHLIDEKNYLPIMKCILVLQKRNRSTSKLENRAGCNSEVSWKKCSHLALVENTLRIPGDEMAVATMSMILESYEHCEPFKENELILVRMYIDCNICNLNKNQRVVFISLVDQIVKKLTSKAKPNSAVINDLFYWLRDRCYKNLFPGSSFGRRFIALKILHILNDAGVYSFENTTCEEKCIILSYLADSFEENKMIARNIMYSTSVFFDSFSSEQISELCEEIKDMISGPRFREHDTAAYLLEVMERRGGRNFFTKFFMNRFDLILGDEEPYFNCIIIFLHFLDERLKAFSKEFSHTLPVYGFLTMIRRLFHLIESRNVLRDFWSESVRRIIEVSIKCNTVAATVVTQLSPEGYLPQDELEDFTEDDVTCSTSSQRLLLFSWRTVTEASSLLITLIDKFSSSTNELNGEVLINEDLMLRIGIHLKSLILKIRHRGAYKKVYNSLRQYCRLCWRYSNNSVISSLPENWAKEIVNRLETDGGGNEFCVSRRSAGIPYLIQAVLSTENEKKMGKHGASELLNSFIETMFRILDQGKGLQSEILKQIPDKELQSKIHAANILRVLFRDKELSDQMNCFVEKAVKLSISGIQSAYWNERNVSWLMFASLIIKIFGVARSKHEISSKNRMTANTFFRKYPSLYELFKTKLDATRLYNESFARSSVYPVLLILLRLEVSCGYSCEQYGTFELHSFIPLLLECCQSPVWKIRELAVRAILPFIRPDNYIDHVSTLWCQINTLRSCNSLHGLLMQLRTLLQNSSKINEDTQNLYLSMLEDSVHLLESEQMNWSYIIRRELLLSILLLTKLVSYDEISTDVISNLKSKLKNLIDKSFFDAQHSNSNCELFFRNSCAEDLIATMVCIYAGCDGLVEFLESIVNNSLSVKLHQVVLESIGLVLMGESSANFLSYAPAAVCNHKKKMLASFSLYSFLMDQLKNNLNCEFGDGLTLALNCLFVFIESSTIDSSSEILPFLSNLSVTCHKYGEKCVLIIVRCVDVMYKKYCNNSEVQVQVITDKILISLVKMLTTSYSDTLCAELIKFFFKKCSTLSWRDRFEIDIELCMWSLMLFHSLSSNAHKILDHVKYIVAFDEKSTLLQVLLKEFFFQNKNEYMKAAVAFTAWILKDIGHLLNTDESSIFVRNVPTFLEDHLIISDVASMYLHQILVEFPGVVHQPIIDQCLLRWLIHECGVDEKRNIFNLCEFTTSIISKFEQEDKLVSYLRANSWMRQMILNKVRLLPLSLRVNKNSNL